MKLDKLNKKELLNIISNMKKKELIQIIKQKGGEVMEENKVETKNAIRSPLKYDSSILIKNNNENNNENIMRNNKIYNDIKSDFNKK